LAKNTLQEKFGLRYIRKIVEGQQKDGMESDWQPFEQSNDDGIDGFIIFRKKGEVTGEIVFVQSKCLSKYQDSPGGRKEYIGINLGQEYIQTHIPRWKKMIAPVVVVYTKYANSDEKAIAWWADAIDEKSYSETEKSYLLIPKRQRFKAHSIGDLKKLCGDKQQDYKLQSIVLDRNDVGYIKLSSQMRTAAKDYYNLWKKGDVKERTNPTLGEIIINRVGWRHITRHGRKTERIIQSWQLLGVAKRMIMEIEKPEFFGRSRKRIEDDFEIFESYMGLRAFVTFPHRYESTVTVVLRLQRKISRIDGTQDKPKIWFFSVYETKRGRSPKRLARDKNGTPPEITFASLKTT
jgi:hypothetical protein